MNVGNFQEEQDRKQKERAEKERQDREVAERLRQDEQKKLLKQQELKGREEAARKTADKSSDASSDTKTTSSNRRAKERSRIPGSEWMTQLVPGLIDAVDGVALEE
jgi:hypothetical protein